ncbi:3-hydroxyacyl-CoA dehydrogenase NAD-binding domain-containing protein, partial [Ellagibacter isourolithinifaciens]|uniref:3-hydroxyacyl-CoA dehydrogenase NAD-binding domain-containing protein n=1 Tax=Ellagibacter isourolithinifaciens TaxID=2137581 RepID=UPI003AB06BA1
MRLPRGVLGLWCGTPIRSRAISKMNIRADRRSDMTIKNVVVAGGGVLGSQIAYQAAYKGFAVTVWLRSEGSVERAK